MKKIYYLKIQNFKVFGQPITIELDQPSVLIGPNNSGKTTVIQALALWHLGITKWYQNGIKKGLTVAIPHPLDLIVWIFRKCRCYTPSIFGKNYL